MFKKLIVKDERTEKIYHEIGSKMFAITIWLILSAMIYRRFILGQSPKDFRDLQFIIAITAILYIGANLYYGGILSVRLKSILIRIYITLVIVSLIIGILSNNITNLTEGLTSIITVTVSYLFIIIIYWIISYFGMKKIKKDLS